MWRAVTEFVFVTFAYKNRYEIDIGVGNEANEQMTYVRYVGISAN